MRVISNIPATAPGTATVSPPDLAPRVWELAALALATCLDAMLLTFGGYQVINVLSPLIMMVVVGAANWELTRKVPEALWTPIFAVRLSALIFFGLGGLAPHLVGERGADYILSIYHFTAAEGAKVHTIWMTSMCLLLTAARLFHRVGAGAGAAAERTADRRDPTVAMGVILYSIGLLVTLVIEIPVSLGLTDFALPGAVYRVFGASSAVGLFLLATVAIERGGGALIGVWLLLAINILISMVLLTKINVILSSVFICLAYLMRGVTFRRLLLVTVAMTALVLVFNPLTAYQRSVQMAQYGESRGGSVGERLGSAVDFFAGNRFEASMASDQSVIRFSFLNVAAYVVSRYDSHQPSNSVEAALISIIPRVLWPDKPMVSNLGSEVWYELTGQEGTSTGVTVPADVYWNLGWLGIFVIFPILGFPLMAASNLSYRIISSRNWLMMPFVVMCYGICLGMSGLFVIDVFAPAAIAGIAYWLLRFVSAVLPGVPLRPRYSPLARLR